MHMFCHFSVVLNLTFVGYSHEHTKIPVLSIVNSAILRAPQLGVPVKIIAASIAHFDHDQHTVGSLSTYFGAFIHSLNKVAVFGTLASALYLSPDVGACTPHTLATQN
jgi:hypothetical protein